jgi:hypothetical protein
MALFPFVRLNREIANVKLLRLTTEGQSHSAYEPAGITQDYIFREMVVENILIGVFLNSEFGLIDSTPE